MQEKSDIMSKKEEGIWILKPEYFNRLTEENMQFVIGEAEAYLSVLIGVSEKITERSYSLLRIVISLCPILLGVFIGVDIQAKSYLVLLTCVCFILSAGFLFFSFRPYRSQCLGDSPKTVVYAEDIEGEDVGKNLKRSKIEAYQRKIEIMRDSNEIRARYFRRSLYALAVYVMTFAIIAVVLAFRS